MAPNSAVRADFFCSTEFRTVARSLTWVFLPKDALKEGSASCPWSVCKAANKGEGGTPPKAPSELCRSHRWGTAFMFSCLAPLTWGHHRGYRHLIFLSILPSQLQLQMYLLNPLPPALGPSRLQSLVEADSRRSHQKTFPGQEEE